MNNYPSRDSLAKAVTIIRTYKGLSRGDLAETSGLSYPYICEIEKAGKEPSFRTVVLIASALNVTLSSLMRIAEDIEANKPLIAGLDEPVVPVLA